MNATMPSSFEASLFAVESIFPEQLSEQTGPHAKDHYKLDEDEITGTIERLWGKDKGLDVRPGWPAIFDPRHGIPS